MNKFETTAGTQPITKNMNVYIFQRLIVGVVSTVIGLAPLNLSASFLDEAWGVITDPLKLDSSSENIIHAVERASIHLDRLEGKLNDDLKDRLTQLDNTIENTRRQVLGEGGDVDRILKESMFSVTELEKQIFADAKDLVKCAAVLGVDQIKSGMAKTLNDFGKRKPRVTVFGIPLIKVKLESSDIPTPIDGFFAVKFVYDDILNNVTEDDHPSKITLVFGELQRLADEIRCHYKSDTKNFQDLYWYELENRRLERHWIGYTENL